MVRLVPRLAPTTVPSHALITVPAHVRTHVAGLAIRLAWGNAKQPAQVHVMERALPVAKQDVETAAYPHVT